jgi:hypothetical protein
VNGSFEDEYQELETAIADAYEGYVPCSGVPWNRFGEPQD